MKCVSTSALHSSQAQRVASCGSVAKGRRGRTLVNHSVWTAPHGLTSVAHKRIHQRTCVYPDSSVSAPGGGSEDEASFFIRNLRALPWQRAAVWLVVIVTALQLSDFFGVCSALIVHVLACAVSTRRDPFRSHGLQRTARYRCLVFPEYTS